jgi:hypothetical protein
MLSNVVQFSIPKYFGVTILHAARSYSIGFQNYFGRKIFVKLPKIIKYLHENHNRLQGNVYFGCVVG